MVENVNGLSVDFKPLAARTIDAFWKRWKTCVHVVTWRILCKISNCTNWQVRAHKMEGVWEWTCLTDVPHSLHLHQLCTPCSEIMLYWNVTPEEKHFCNSCRQTQKQPLATHSIHCTNVTIEHKQIHGTTFDYYTDIAYFNTTYTVA